MTGIPESTTSSSSGFMAYFTSDLQPTQGFHPTSSNQVLLPGPKSLYSSCTLHLYFTLPPLVFVDTHELAQRSGFYKYNHWGSRDIEKPTHALPNEHSEVLINVIDLEDAFDEAGGPIGVEVPMHLRYGTPRPSTKTQASQDTLYDKIHVDWPQAFLLCPPTCVLLSLCSGDRRTTYSDESCDSISEG